MLHTSDTRRASEYRSRGKTAHREGFHAGKICISTRSPISMIAALQHSTTTADPTLRLQTPQWLLLATQSGPAEFTRSNLRVSITTFDCFPRAAGVYVSAGIES